MILDRSSLPCPFLMLTLLLALAPRFAAAQQVRLGIDVLEDQDFAPLRSPGEERVIGLLTNHTGRDSLGRRTIDVLAAAPGIELAAIFSPEHGVAGEFDTTDIDDTRDSTTGIPVHSLYGAREEQRRVPAELLRRLDAVVVDLQDSGARFFTYITTLGYLLEAAARADVEVFVLDRPDLINGSAVQGPLPDADRESFMNYHPVPVRYGMTLGEFARMFNAERRLEARLTVVPMRGWRRERWYDQTGLEWRPPSPNLRTLTQAALYPGVALLEYTNVSVGRGTSTPFELLGAPWMDASRLTQYLNRRHIPGVRFQPAEFTPKQREYAGQLCHGVRIVLRDRDGLDSPRLGLELAAALLRLHRESFQPEKLMILLANQAVYDALLTGSDPARIAADWSQDIEGFYRRRRPFLLYPDKFTEPPRSGETSGEQKGLNSAKEN